MLLTINKWGNSQGIRFPKDLLKKLHTKVGSSLNVEYQDGKLIIEPIGLPKKYNIHELVAGINSEDNTHVSKEVNWGKLEGKEVW